MSASLTRGESAILDLWDAGERDREAIARATGCTLNSVNNVISFYAVNDETLSTFDRMSAAGTKALLAALHTFHPETRRGVHP